MTEQEYTNYSMCSSCGGACCKRIPGIYSPEDFNEKSINEEFIVALLKSGRISIDWWEGDPEEKSLSDILLENIGESQEVLQKLINEYYKKYKGLIRVYYLRPRIVNSPIIHPAWVGTCINFSQNNGCNLSFDERPYQCKALIPNYDFLTKKPKCGEKENSIKRELVIKWKSHQGVINSVMEKIKNLELIIPE